MGDPCIVKIGIAQDYGGSTTFNINGLDQQLFENTNIDKLLASERKVVKLLTPGSHGKDIEIVVMQLDERRLPVSLRMVRKNDFLHTQEKSIVCDSLVRQ